MVAESVSLLPARMKDKSCAHHFLSRHHGAARSVHLQPRLLMLAGACVVGASLLAGGFMGAWLFRAPAPVAGIEVDAALQAQSAEISSAARTRSGRWTHRACISANCRRAWFGWMRPRRTSHRAGRRRPRRVRLLPERRPGGVDEPLEGSAYAPPSFMATLTNWRHASDTQRAAARGAGATARRQAHQPVDLPGRPAGAPGYISSPFGRRSIR